MTLDPEARKTQASAFLEGEADQWFLRNREHLGQFSIEQDLACSILKQQGVQPKRILEIGAANGYRLAGLRERYGCQVQGTDASKLATADGRDRYQLELRCQAAEDFEGIESCDLLVLHFILHWLDRAVLSALTQAVCDGVQVGGHLLIGDFAPDEDIDVPYHHLPDANVFTYKRNYGQHFVDTGCFRQVTVVTASNLDTKPETDVPSQDRIGMWLLERVT